MKRKSQASASSKPGEQSQATNSIITKDPKPKKVINPKVIKSNSLPSANSVQKVLFSKTLLKNKYEKSFLQEAQDPDRCFCTTCDRVISFQYRKIHLSDNHWKNTPAKDKGNMKTLAKLYSPEWEPKGEKEEVKQSQDQVSTTNLKGKIYLNDEIKSSYLEFLCFMIAERHSFEQIMRLGLFLKDKFSKINKAGFIKEMSFDSELISDLITNCVAKDLKEQLINSLKTSPFSLTLDTCTIMGDQICIVRARYIQEKFDPLLNEKVSSIKNQIVAVEELTTSSSGMTFYNILKNRILSHAELKKNWVGICHDGAANLSGNGIGLVGLLSKNEKENYFDLHDPCHCYDLALEAALQKLPSNFISFVRNIHSYFQHSPQRQALLNERQSVSQKPILKLKKYADTRWLSLGNCIERLLKVWDDLISYFEHLQTRKSNENEFLTLLKQNEFKMKTKIISILILKLNSFNIRLQAHRLEIHQLKLIIHETLIFNINALLKEEKKVIDFEKWI